ncbi:S-4TM family putative pore-forming effector [Rhodanobacter sp. OK091]|uniref:S-4TM family putative pore-forming effector n=1 Tax=Rhodanobacter sp. OK091 TaxID=1881037 RepID=UPI000915C51D|nr:S-4TM family putative pore-forming effector [Rhodanobacter sp. OK091]SHM51831.1 hypothetical protein SAMN05428972_3884 [Rhodanobacter sp. OK091]
MNAIVSLQNSAEALTLLRARRRTLDRVKRAQRAYFIAALILPVASVVAAAWWQGGKPWVSFVALLVAMLDFYCLDRWQKEQIKLSARLQEQFDCLVLDVPWNSFTATKKVIPEDVFELGGDKLSASVEKTFPNWYPASVQGLPLHLARLACQRTNLWYDAALRNHYARCILWFELVIVAALLASGFILGTSFADFVLTKLVPFVPLVMWLERERRRHKDTEITLSRLLDEIEASIDKFIDASSHDDAQGRSRQLQDAIFLHRATSPLVSNILYKLKRSRMEPKMHVGVEEFIKRLAVSVNGRGAL